MIRRHFTFDCEGSALVATLDRAQGPDGSAHDRANTGLLIVSGGNEVRSGAWNGQALLAARVAAAGFPVMRYDRRGIGDSAGPNGGFRSSAPDIAAALAAFHREQPQLTRVIAFGNCDAASALMLVRGQGFTAMVLSNPWTYDDTIAGAEGEPAPAVPSDIRAHYAQRLKDPAALLRVLKGGVNWRKLLGSLRAAAASAPQPSSLAQEMAEGLGHYNGPVAILLATRDRTARAFADAWPTGDARIRKCKDASHSYVEPQEREWLTAQVLRMLG
ncbi:MAG: hydrolase 1, exosortase A system-associated [Novosphingobium sp.]